MKPLKLVLLAMCIGFVLWPLRCPAETVYVHSRIAPLMAAPSLTATRIGELKLGDRLQADRLQNGWYHVESQNGSGWINRLMVKSYPPAKTQKIASKSQEHLARRARVRPSSLASTAAARGLRTDRKRCSLKLWADYKALAKMESFRVTPQEARSFLAKGSDDVTRR